MGGFSSGLESGGGKSACRCGPGWGLWDVIRVTVIGGDKNKDVIGVFICVVCTLEAWLNWLGWVSD